MKKVNGKTQIENLISYFRDGNRYITPAQARQVFGIERLASRMHDLRMLGYTVEAYPMVDAAGTRYTRYFISPIEFQF